MPSKALLLMLMLLLASSSVYKLNLDLTSAFALENPDTDVGGAITANTTRTSAGSPYTLTTDVLVLVGVFLNIQPGVSVRFENGTSIILDGTLSAQGDSAQRILFTSNLPSPALGDWGSIRTRTGGRIVSVVWATIEYSAGESNFQQIHLA